ncbi:glucuronosyltransferase, partial [Sarracenia purpurea var. burkii]
SISSDYPEVLNLDDLSSDHFLVVLSISTTPLKRIASTSISNKSTNWELFRKNSQNSVNLNIKFKAPDALDLALTGFTNIMIESAISSTPNKVPIGNKEILYPEEVLRMAITPLK